MNHWLSPQNDREPQFAGRFYTGDKKKLLKELDELFGQAKPPVNINQKPQAIISPHAGYVFSGQVAASAFNQIPGKARFKRVFVLASSHHFHFRGGSVYTKGNYKTPLGEVEVDIELAKQLAGSGSLLSDNPDAHGPEHSLEVQLPFLQYKLGTGFLLVPIILGTNSPSDCKKVAELLSSYFIPENLFVASTDFSHYPSYHNATDIDAKTAKAITTNNPDILLEKLDDNKQQAIPGLSTSLCGWTSVLTLMYLTEKKGFEYRLVDYKNSGDNLVFGDKDRVVGYHAIVAYNKQVFDISEGEKQSLLKLARRSLNQSYGLGKFDTVDLDLSGVSDSELGAFVSLYHQSQLQGCIGRLEGCGPLKETIRDMAVSASNDRRFEKPSAGILDELTIEISVLSPLKKIKLIDEIELGRHGIYIRNGFNSGTFLPQVADKTGWTLEEFLGHCSRDKAGLGWNGWKNSDIFIYEAVVFSDKTL